MRAMLVLAMFGLLTAGSAAGDRAFREGRYEAAVAEYARAIDEGRDTPELRYNLGTSLLRLGRFAEAREQLLLAARVEATAVRQAAHYNAGNADLEPAFVAAATPERRAALERAIQQYKQALLLDATDLDAKWNLELAQRLLAQQAGAGGGADEDAPRGGGGGGGDDRSDPARPDPSPGAAEGPGTDPQMSRAEAEEVLRAASEREAELQQEKLSRAQPPPPNVRDW